MKYKYQKVRMPDSLTECDLDIRDSELWHIDMDKFWARTKKVTGNTWMDKLVGSGLYFAAGLPVSTINNEFIMLVGRCYNKDTRCVENEDGKVIINLTA